VSFDLDKLSEIPDPFAEELPPAAPPPPLPASGPSRARLRTVAWLACAIVLMLEVAWLLKAGMAPGRATTPLLAALAFGLPALAAALGWTASLRPGRLGLGLPAARLGVVLGLTLAAFVASAFYLPTPVPFTIKSTVGCGATVTMLGALPFVAGALVFRRKVLGAVWLRAALFGIACGALGAALVRMHCAKDSIAHLLVGHGAGIVVFGLVASFLARRFMRP
jgi:Negative regulator of sigma F